jgi:hypothetical protein
MWNGTPFGRDDITKLWAIDQRANLREVEIGLRFQF